MEKISEKNQYLDSEILEIIFKIRIADLEVILFLFNVAESF